MVMARVAIHDSGLPSTSYHPRVAADRSVRRQGRALFPDRSRGAVPGDELVRCTITVMCIARETNGRSSTLGRLSNRRPARPLHHGTVSMPR
jgi:hypothetical protein